MNTVYWGNREGTYCPPTGSTNVSTSSITLGVFADNPSALKCYQSVGFKITGEASYMIDGEKWKGYEMKYVNYIQKAIECVKDSVLPIHEKLRTDVTFCSSELLFK